MDTYFICCITIQCFFIYSVLNLSQFWPLGALSVGPGCFFELPYHYGIFLVGKGHVLTFWCYQTLSVDPVYFLPQCQKSFLQSTGSFYLELLLKTKTWILSVPLLLGCSPDRKKKIPISKDSQGTGGNWLWLGLFSWELRKIKIIAFLFLYRLCYVQ